MLALAVFVALAGCQSTPTPDVSEVKVTMLTDQLQGCVTELLAQKGGSVVIKSPAQYINFGNELNALGASSELCESEVVLPEIDFTQALFVAKNASATCGLDYLEPKTGLEDTILTVSFAQRELGPDEAICESFVEGAVAAEVSEIPEGVTVKVD